MSSSNHTRVVVISDQPIFLQGLSALVLATPDMSMVGQGRTAGDAIQLCHMSEPDLVLLDFKNALEQGRETAGEIRKHWPTIKVILLLRPQDENQFQDDPDSGLHYYFSRDITEEEFKAALEEVKNKTLHGEPPGISGMHAEGENDPEDEDRPLQRARRSQMARSEAVLERELLMAGKIQADILPEAAPVISGWDICARLEPARETSGDFYDFIPLTNHKWGIVVADVTDKGMGAALFMALSSTLMRTYASRFPTLPAIALNAVNNRILSDTRGSMFVTAFFGILEPLTGRFIFANAGHPPAFMVSPKRGKESVDYLRHTGMALGVTEQAQWKQKVVKLAAGDFLVLYTDGITEAQRMDGEFFEEERLLDVVLAHGNCPAREIQNALLEEVHRFVGGGKRQDDIALIVIKREE